MKGKMGYLSLIVFTFSLIVNHSTREGDDQAESRILPYSHKFLS